MSQIKFSDLKLNSLIQVALKKVGYEVPTPIQEQTIPLVLEGNDVLGIAQTGTGKTASFCLPMINHLLKNTKKRQAYTPRALILTPTRELAIQIHQNLESYGAETGQNYGVVFGGVNQNPQVRQLKQGLDVLVATPGRLLDLIQQKYIRLNSVEIFVLDEADRMLDMGFMRDIKRILPLLPAKRQNLFYSATMPKEIQILANTILTNPKKVEVTPPATTVKKITQSVMYVTKPNKIKLLVHLLKGKKDQKTLVFVEMKHVANKVTDKLKANGIPAVAIHGNKSQSARQKAIQDFTNNQVRVMVATDIASRGIDIDGITHVINFELSNLAESYVHRIGRTARAGADGEAISLVTAEEKSYLVNVERTTKQAIPVDEDQPYHSREAQLAPVVKVGKAKADIERARKQFRGKSKSKSKTKSSRPGQSKKKTTSKKASSAGGDQPRSAKKHSKRPTRKYSRPTSTKS